MPSVHKTRGILDSERTLISFLTSTHKLQPRATVLVGIAPHLQSIFGK
jgi:hypothetical protein